MSTTTTPPGRDKYVGRFAPSPTGPLHAGSLVAALASYLDARAHGGEWLVRIEDIDEGRSMPGAAEDIVALLGRLGMASDREVVWQSRRKPLYEAAARQLGAAVYPCGCNRREINDSRLGVGPDGAAIYPGTCRQGLAPGREMRSLRLRVPAPPNDTIVFVDRLQGEIRQRLASESGDFVLKRADGYWAYQLAVVVDDAEQGVTDIVRGVDLIDSTARQIFLQGLLGVPTPRYLHVPVLRNANGEKLSKQTGAPAVLANTEAEALAALTAAAEALGLRLARPETRAGFWEAAVPAWTAMLERHAAGRKEQIRTGADMDYETIGRYIHASYRYGGSLGPAVDWLAHDLGVAPPATDDSLAVRNLFSAFVAKHATADALAQNHARFVQALERKR